MAIALEGPSSADMKMTVNLEGQAYDIRYRWNGRSESWFLYIGMSGNTPVLKTRMVVGADLLFAYRGVPDLPPGRLFLTDVEKDYGRAGLEDVGLNKRFMLVYVRSTEPDPLAL